MGWKATDERRDEVLRNLRDVGLKKLVGYLPLYAILHCLLTIEDVRDEATQRGMASSRFGPDQCRIHTGAFYVYDRASLRRLLLEYSEIFRAKGWSTDPDAFVRVIARKWLKPHDPLMPLILKAFGD